MGQQPEHQAGEPVFFRGGRWRSAGVSVLPSSSSFPIRRSRVRFSASDLQSSIGWNGGGDSTITAAATQQQPSFLSRQAEASFPALSDEAFGEGAEPAAAAGAAAAASFPDGASAAAAVAGGSFLEVLSSADACASSEGSMGLRVREMLGWAALGVLALKLLLRPDKACRPKRVLLLDFIKTVAAWQLLQLWPPYELPQPTTSATARAQDGGAVEDSCDVYAAAQLIEAVIWLFVLKLLLRQAETMLGYEQGEYLMNCQCRASGAYGQLNVTTPESCITEECGCSRLETDQGGKRSLAIQWGIDWGRYMKQLAVLMICVAAAQFVTLFLLLLLAASLAPIVAAPLWLLHRGSATLRRFIVAFACPICTDLLQFCSLDALIRRRPPPESCNEDSLRFLSHQEGKT